MSNKRFDIIFIDFDKTLFDIQIPDYEGCRRIMRRVLNEQFHIDSDLRPILSCYSEIIMKNRDAGEYILNYLNSMEQESEVKIYSYTIKLLSMFKGQPVGIVSSNGIQIIQKCLDFYRLNQYIGAIISRDNYEFFKPAYQVLEYCTLKLLGDLKQVKKFLMIGDSQIDYDTANAFSGKYQIPYEFIYTKDVHKLLN